MMTELEQKAIASLKEEGIVPTIDAVRAWALGYKALVSRIAGTGKMKSVDAPNAGE